jgi:hypothetical protein
MLRSRTVANQVACRSTTASRSAKCCASGRSETRAYEADSGEIRDVARIVADAIGAELRRGLVQQC